MFFPPSIYVLKKKKQLETPKREMQSSTIFKTFPQTRPFLPLLCECSNNLIFLHTFLPLSIEVLNQKNELL